jgi:hypothetical protein
MARLFKVAMTKQREGIGGKKGGERKKGCLNDYLPRRALASAAPCCGPRAPAWVAPFYPPWRTLGATSTPQGAS